MLLFLLFIILSIENTFCDRFKVERIDYSYNPKFINVNASVENGILNIDFELLTKVDNARVYLVASYGRDYRNLIFNRTVNLNKAFSFIGISPLSIAIMTLIKDSIDVPFVFPVAKVFNFEILHY